MNQNPQNLLIQHNLEDGLVAIKRHRIKRTLRLAANLRIKWQTRSIAPLFQHESMDSEDGKRVTHNVSARVPGFGMQSFCFSTDKKNIERDNKAAFKKTSSYSVSRY